MVALEGQVAVVTGGGSGIGAAIALTLAAASVQVHLIGRSPRSLREVSEKARSLGAAADYLVADLEDEPELNALTSRLAQEWPRLDILVQNAAMHIASPIAQASLADLDKHHRVNVRAPCALVRSLLPQLEVNKGQVVFVNSISGINAKATTNQPV